MAEQDEDLSFLSFFLNEPIYLLPEAEPVFQAEAQRVEEDQIVAEVIQSEPGEITEVATDDAEKEISLALPETEGQNRKGVLILFHNPDGQVLEASSAALLEKILNAVKHDMDDVARCNWALLEHQQQDQKNIFESLQLIDAQKIIAFGDLPLSWSISHFFQKYHITEDGSGKGLLQVDDLSIIAQNRDLKVKLWESLQKLFK